MSWTDITIAFVLIGSLIGQAVQAVGGRRHGRHRPGRLIRVVRTVIFRAIARDHDWRRRWYGCPPVRRHRAPREVAARRDWFDRTGVAWE